MDAEDRPWGSYAVLADEVDHKVKRIIVDPGMRLSYQRHARRAEHWFFLGGDGVFVLDGVERAVAAGDSVDIPLEAAHRIENRGDDPLVFVEVQHGTYFGEDDIVRLEDDYGRLSDRVAVPADSDDGASYGATPPTAPWRHHAGTTTPCSSSTATTQRGDAARRDAGRHDDRSTLVRSVARRTRGRPEE